MRIAVIADVHGNLAALEAVIAAIPACGADATVNLGDLISGPFDPAGSADAQMKSGYLTIAGNHDRQLTDEATAPSTYYRGRSCRPTTGLGSGAFLPH